MGSFLCALRLHDWAAPIHDEQLGLLDYRCKRRGCAALRVEDDGTQWTARMVNRTRIRKR